MAVGLDVLALCQPQFVVEARLGSHGPTWAVIVAPYVGLQQLDMGVLGVEDSAVVPADKIRAGVVIVVVAVA